MVRVSINTVGLAWIYNLSTSRWDIASGSISYMAADNVAHTSTSGSVFISTPYDITPEDRINAIKDAVITDLSVTYAISVTRDDCFLPF